MFEKLAKKKVEKQKIDESSKLVEHNSETKTENREKVLNSSLSILKKKDV